VAVLPPFAGPAAFDGAVVVRSPLPNIFVLPPLANAASSFVLSFFDRSTAEGCCADGLLRGEVNGRLDAMQGQIDSITNDVSDLRAQVDECRVPLEGNSRRDRDEI
jgi:hypothetical protein